MLEDFRRLNPNDVGTWPVIPRVVILVGLFVLLVTAGWWFVWQDQLIPGKQTQTTRSTEGGVSCNKKRQSVNLDLYLQQLNEIDRSFD